GGRAPERAWGWERAGGERPRAPSPRAPRTPPFPPDHPPASTVARGRAGRKRADWRRTRAGPTISKASRAVSRLAAAPSRRVRRGDGRTHGLRASEREHRQRERACALEQALRAARARGRVG